MKDLKKLNFSDWWSFGLGLGFVWPSGTMGSFLGVAIVMILSLFHWQVGLCITILITAYSWYACCQTYKKLNCDHTSIVSDEVVGMMLSLLFLEITWPSVILGFLLFRFFDISKVWPVCFFERKEWKAHGIMLDDVAAGILTNIALQIILNPLII